MTQSSAGGASPRAMDHPDARLSLGVYVLGSIDPAERSLVDAHLATCQDCRDELAGLAGLPALLGRVSKEEAVALAATDEPLPADETPEPAPELLASVLDLTTARRRRRRRLEAALGVAAALVAGAAVFGGLQLGSSPAPSGSATTLYAGAPNGAWQSASGKAGSMTATVQYRSMGWGTMLDASVTGIPIGTSCQLWVVNSAGQRVLVSNWVTDSAEGTVWYPASAGLSSSDIKGFQVTVAQGPTIGVRV